MCIQNVKSQLVEYELLVQEYGGDVEVVEISAKTGKGVDHLLDYNSAFNRSFRTESRSQAPYRSSRH
jgi:translation initiation factor IF-2